MNPAEPARERSRAEDDDKELPLVGLLPVDPAEGTGPAQGATPRRADEAEEPPPSGPPPGWDEPRESAAAHPTIRIMPAEIPRMVRETIEALAAGDANLYQRAGDLVTLTREPDRADSPNRAQRVGADVLLRPGTPRVRALLPAVLVERAATCATWTRFAPGRGPIKPDGSREGEWIATAPPGNVIRIVHARQDWPGIRPLRGILEAPSLRPDGTVIDRPGYDPATGYVLLPSCDFPPVPERPTREDAAAALRWLWINVFCDFPYQGIGEPDADDLDRARQYQRACACPAAFVGIEALLSIIARPAIRGAIPGCVFEAATQGSGKTLQIHAISTAATGRPAGVMTFPIGRTGQADEAELEKVLAAYALTGARVIAFDNIKGTLGGSALEKCSTAVDTIDLRVLGASDLRTMPWSAAVLFSGNNLTMTDDVAQRVLVSRLESPHEDPRSAARSFYHPELLSAVRDKRGAIVRAALIVLRAAVVAPALPSCGTWGSFEAWARFIPPAIAYAGGPNILNARPNAGELGQDGEGEAHLTMMRQWFGEPEGIKAGDIIAHLFPRDREQHEPHDGRDELRAAIRTLTGTPEGRTPNPSALGRALRHLRGKIRGGLKLAGGADRNGVVRWQVVKTALGT